MIVNALSLINNSIYLKEINFEKYSKQFFEEVLVFSPARGFGNVFFKSVAFLNYAILNNVMFCIDFSRYPNFNYSEYFSEEYNFEFKKFQEVNKNKNIKITKVNNLSNNYLIDNLGFFYNFWSNTQFNDDNKKINDLISNVFRKLSNLIFNFKINKKFDVKEKEIDLGIQIRLSNNGDCLTSPYSVCDENGINNFLKIMNENKDKKIYIATDSISLKKKLVEKYSNIITFDFNVQHPNNGTSEDNYFSVSEIFNLSKCNKLYLSGGSLNNSKSIRSTFGLLSSILNNVKYEWVYNDV